MQRMLVIVAVLATLVIGSSASQAQSTRSEIGATRKGPVATAELLPEILTSYADFERVYGGFADLQLTVANPAEYRPVNYLAHAVRAYFNEGGSRLYVARVHAANGSATTVNVICFF